MLNRRRCELIRRDVREKNLTTEEAKELAELERIADARVDAIGSTPWIVVVGYPRNEMAGKYLQGPRTPKEVKSRGYGFTDDVDKAWPFSSERAAANKARIVDLHMGWGQGVLIAEQPNPSCEGRPSATSTPAQND
jgi:hypothetical protein